MLGANVKILSTPGKSVPCYSDKEKREVDFVLVKDNTPVALFEAKETDSSISKPGRFYSKKMNIPLFQIVHKAKKVEAFPGNCFVIPASNFLMLTG